MSLAVDLRARLQEVLSCPTAPFEEHRVHACIRAAVRAGKRLRDRVDAHGNLEVVYGQGRPKLLFTCHTDHPAFESNGDGTVTIRGGMRPKELRGVRLRSLDPGGPTATLAGVVRDQHPVVMALRRKKRIPKGTYLILDLPDLRISGGRIRARVIDDLCAVAACLTAMDRLEKARWKGCVGFLFTRAEEVGFAGALGWIRTTRYPRSTTIVNLEMSRALKTTRQGDGPILRVGDRITVFSPDATLELEATARTLRKRDPDFRYQRQLMAGGACEATIFAHGGFRAGALCLALKNTHNHPDRGGVGMEYVSAADAEHLVRWIVEHARRFRSGSARTAFGRRADALWRRHRRRLARTAEEGEG